jgi:alpha/beta superfamily hydrolase
MGFIGFMYETGQGVDQDYQQAMAWLRKAHPIPATNLAIESNFFGIHDGLDRRQC